MADRTILLAEDDASIRLVVNQTLVSAGFAVRATASPDALERWIREGQGDLVISDVYLGEVSIFERLSSLKLARPDLPFLLMSAQNTILTAAEAADKGAFDYLPKPFDIDVLVETVRRALKTPRQSDTLAPQTRRSIDEAGLPLIGRSEAMQGVYRIITRVMNTDLTVLIEGEAGTGKDLAAHAVHELGRAKQGRFVHLDAARLMSGDDLFSIVDGASTIYADEVGDLPPPAQSQLAALLARLEGKRLIASTRTGLARLVEQKRFREDLYYRLGVVRLAIPPLRERKEDIPELAGAFLVRAQHQGLAAKTMDPPALDLFAAYDWPGNVRELENVILRLCALSPDSRITARDVERELRAASHGDLPPEAGLEAEFESLLRRHVLSDLMDPDAGEGARIHQNVVESVERPLISLALQVTAGNKVRAAALLGLNRNTLRARINNLGIPDPG